MQVMRHLNELCKHDELARQALELALGRAVVSTVISELDGSSQTEESKLEEARQMVQSLGAFDT